MDMTAFFFAYVWPVAVIVAQSVMLLVILLTIVQFRFIERRVHYK